jgi:hypothetical protein
MKKKLLALSVLAVVSSQAHAFEFDTPDEWSIRWDNTIKGNLMSRVAAQDKDVYLGRRGNTSGFLADDSDLSVDRSNLGIVSARVDVFSEFDVIYQEDFGFRVSASAWYDYAYKDSDHPSDRRYTWASPSVDPGEYNDETEDLHYFGGELLDAFVFGNWEIGDTALGVRAGRHTIYWGNSLLGGGAIAGVGGSMAPLDFAKAFAVPGTEAKELFLPYGKLSAVYQVTNNLTLNGYYGFEHRPHRLPETSSYFSPAEGLTEDTEFITFPPGPPEAPFRTGFDMKDNKVEDNEWGFNVQYYVDAWSLETSFIYLNYVDKNLHGLHAGFDVGQFAALAAPGLLPPLNALCPTDPEVDCPTNAPIVDPAAGTIVWGSARWLYKDDNDLYAISLAKEIAGISVGLDVVYRPDTPVSPNLGASLQRTYNVPAALKDTVEAALPFGVIDGDYFGYDSDNYLGALGDVWSVVINGIGLLSDNGIWEGGSYIFEGTFVMLDDCTENCQLLNAGVKENRVVTRVGGIFKPTWFQAFPGTDLSVPMSVNYTIHGTSPLSFGGNEGGGTASIGLEFDIEQIWRVTAKYNVFYGPVTAGIGGLLKDRDNVTLTVKRTF